MREYFRASWQQRQDPEEDVLEVADSEEGISEAEVKPSFIIKLRAGKTAGIVADDDDATKSDVEVRPNKGTSSCLVLPRCLQKSMASFAASWRDWTRSDKEHVQ